MIRCNVCLKKQKLYFTYKKFRYYKCNSCGLVSTLPLPTQRMILEHYDKKFRNGNYELLLKYENEYKQVYSDFIIIIKNILKKGKQNPHKLSALDIGCFTGSFLQMLKEIGFKVNGLELQKEAVQIAQKRLPKQVFESDVMKDKMPNGKYDLVCMLGLIEHVTDPYLLIKKCRKLLNDEGLLLIQTPNSSSIPARILKKYWPPYAPIEHINLFSRQSLVNLLSKHGFEIIHESNHIKKLPFSYVYNMLSNFGPEFKTILKPLDFLMPRVIKRFPLPFYVGEIIIVAKKLPKN